MGEAVRLNEVQTPRALFRQPLALQWFEDGELVKRKEGERQAGKGTSMLLSCYILFLTYRCFNRKI